MSEAKTQRSRSREVTLAAIVVILSSLFALGAAELVSRAMEAKVSPHAFWPINMRRVLHPDPALLPGVTGPAHFVTDSTGVRATEMQAGDRQRILVLGGSTAECLYLDSAETWAALVQRELMSEGVQAWVGNAGISGRSAAHHLAAMRHYPFAQRRISAVIVLVGANDLGRRLTLDTLYQPLKGDERLASTFMGALRPFESHTDTGFRRMALWRLVRRVRGAGAVQNVQDTRGEMYAEWRRQRLTAPTMRGTLPNLDAALADYRALLDSIADAAAENSVDLMLLTQPTLWRSDLTAAEDALLWMGGGAGFQSEGATFYTPGALAVGMNAYNDVLRSVCAERRLRCLDLARAVPSDTSVFYDDMHFNEHGARQVAQHVATMLLKRRD